MTPSIRFRSIALRSLRSLCGTSFLNGILHTEIAKVTKTDSNWMTPSIRGSGPLLSDLCANHLFCRSFTLRGRKRHNDRFGLNDRFASRFVPALQSLCEFPPLMSAHWPKSCGQTRSLPRRRLPGARKNRARLGLVLPTPEELFQTLLWSSSLGIRST